MTCAQTAPSSVAEEREREGRDVWAGGRSMSVRNRSPIMDLPNLKTPDTVDLRLAWISSPADARFVGLIPFNLESARLRHPERPPTAVTPSAAEETRGRWRPATVWARVGGAGERQKRVIWNFSWGRTASPGIFPVLGPVAIASASSRVLGRDRAPKDCVGKITRTGARITCSGVTRLLRDGDLV